MKDNQIASSLRTVISKMNRKLRKHTSAMGELSISEIDTLSFLYNNGCLSPAKLAELNQIKGQSMSEVLTHLKAIGLIDKQQSVTDKRKFDVSLTGQGKNIVEQARDERDGWLSKAIGQKLSDQEKETLSEAITLLGRLADS